MGNISAFPCNPTVAGPLGQRDCLGLTYMANRKERPALALEMSDQRAWETELKLELELVVQWVWKMGLAAQLAWKMRLDMG